jgi:NADPH:quinone reductase-like Zn-dependent oxidoreductase
VLTASIAALADRGTLVCLGNSSGQPAQFPTSAFYRCPGSRILGFQLMDELRRTGTGGRDLGYVMSLAAAGALSTQIARRVSWRDADQLIDALLGRGVRGKAVLDID